MTARREDGNRKAAGRSRKTAREAALDTLVKVHVAEAYSNLQLNRALRDAQLDRPDAALATELVYGTIQRLNTLDYWLQQFVAKGFHKLEPWVLQLLRMSAYQLLYLDRIPPHAAVNEAVQLAKKRGHAGISGMVNGVLRALVRGRASLSVPDDGSVGSIALRESHPEWLVARWASAYGAARAAAICHANNMPPKASLRVNRLRATRETALAELAAEGYKAEPSALCPYGIIVDRGGNLAEASGYLAGHWSVQDESAMLVAEAAAPQPGMDVLDCCAAPGGKSVHLAELMGDQGRIWANDIHPFKAKLIEDQAARLGLRSITVTTGDAAELGERFAPGSFDVAVLDAPCSGFGVIRRRPEIKWTKSPEDVAAIAGVQRLLLDAAAELVRPGGVLLYSTCTIERQENEEQISQFLERHSAFRLDPQWPDAVLAPLQRAGVAGGDFSGMIQLLPDQFGSDGFFIARLRKHV